MTPERYKKVGEIFHAATELPREKRAAFLTEVCGEDEELRREVESLLASDENVGDFIESPALEVAAEILADEQAKEKIGREIASYKIVSLIGAGGMGEVWLAQDSKLKRQVALKLLAANQLSAKQDRLRRFEQEAHAVSALNHPNIITIFDIGVSDGWQFIATEFIEGKTLRQLFKEKSLTAGEAVDIAAQIAAALSAAHSAGIVHRDIKPENVMVRADGIVKVLDFGLARFTEKSAPNGDAKFITTPGMVMGTAAYMSPEQARGQAVDERTDIFSLGIVFYEMLAGKLPFEGVNEIEVLSAILHREPLELAENIPDAVKNIDLKMLVKNRDGRYQTAAEVLDDLRAVKRDLEFQTELSRHNTADGLRNPRTQNFNAVTGKNAPRKTGGVIMSAAGWSLQNKIVAAMALLLIVTLGIAVSLQFFPRQSASAAVLSEADKLLIADFENKTGDEDFDGLLRQPLAISLGQSPFFNLVPDGQVRQTLKTMDKSNEEPLTVEIAREICQRRGVKAFLKGTIENYGVQYLITLEAFNGETGELLTTEKAEAVNKDAVLEALGKAATKMRGKLGESIATIEKFDSPIVTSTSSSIEALRVYTAAFRKNQQGLHAESIPLLKKAVEIDPNFAAAYGALAVNYYNLNENATAAHYAEKAFALRDRTTEREKLRLTSFYYTFATGEIEKDIETLELYKQAYPRDNLPPANLSASYTDIGKFVKAEENARLSMSIDPAPYVPRLQLGNALLKQNRFDEAKAVYEEAINKGAKNDKLNAGLFDVALVQNDEAGMQAQIEAVKGKDLAFLWQAKPALFAGKWREYEKLMTQALAITEKDSKDIAADDASRVALNAAAFGKCKEAQSWSNRALKLERTEDALTNSALVLALCGSNVDALVTEIKERHPKKTIVNGIWLPLIRAAAELKNEPERAVESLQINRQYEGAEGFWSNYLRGLAFLKLNKGAEAMVEFEKIRQNRGWSPQSPLYTLALVGQSRASALLNDAENANKFLEQFKNDWKNADADLSVFSEIKNSGTIR
jgi:eukaryotic-like serine/threonine-protein kinase